MLLGLDCSAARANDNVCPSKMTNIVKSGQYDFGYQSWSWPESEHFAFCHCVRNYSESRAIFISWKEAGLIGWPGPGQVLYAYATAATGTQKKIQAPLWYGALPTVIGDAKIVRPSDDLPLLQSSGAVGFPDLRDIPDKISNSPAALSAYIESNPDKIRTMKMSFESKATVDSDTGLVNSVINTCKYKLSGDPSDFNGRASIYVKFDDPELQRIMFKNDEAVPLGARDHGAEQDRYRLVDGSFQMTGWQPTSPTEAKSLLHRETRFLATGRDGTPVLASIPVRFLSSSGR